MDIYTLSRWIEYLKIKTSYLIRSKPFKCNNTHPITSKLVGIAYSVTSVNNTLEDVNLPEILFIDPAQIGQNSRNQILANLVCEFQLYKVSKRDFKKNVKTSRI